jgi:hypothetical protein
LPAGEGASARAKTDCDDRKHLSRHGAYECSPFCTGVYQVFPSARNEASSCFY